MKPLNRLWLYIYSTPNIVGCCLGLLGLLLYFGGIIDRYWFFIVVGLYLAGYVGWPRNEELKLTMNEKMQAEQIEAELHKLLAKIKNRVLKQTLEKVTTITELIPLTADTQALCTRSTVGTPQIL